jgi:hypothetical protein
LEVELLDRSVFENRQQARLAIFDYIERFYNPARRHSSIGGVSPANFEKAGTGRTTGAAVTSRNGSVTAACPVCGRPLPPGRPRTTCGDPCRQAAFRRRHDKPVDVPELPKRSPKKPVTIYECAECETKLLGEQWCEECAKPMKRVGFGGTCQMLWRVDDNRRIAGNLTEPGIRRTAILIGTRDVGCP